MEAKRRNTLPCKKTIYSLPAMRELLLAANRRYLEFLSAMEDNTAGTAS
jgi:hypothetical protein